MSRVRHFFGVIEALSISTLNLLRVSRVYLYVDRVRNVATHRFL